jgi:hypothetical protein
MRALFFALAPKLSRIKQHQKRLPGLEGAQLFTMMKIPGAFSIATGTPAKRRIRMSEQLMEPILKERASDVPRRRHPHGTDEHLVLSEMDPDSVIDHLEPPDAGVELITFGSVRETCPNCPGSHLKLVLRQRRVRLAHLFCSGCQSCFDARYPNGKSALTI